MPATDDAFVLQIDSPASFELYSTLSGKMARMEELLNEIDRFLDQEDFRDRLIADAEEFHQLLNESRGLYPDRLSADDTAAFDLAIDRTADTARQLLDSIREGDQQAARKALAVLSKQRERAHTEFSY